MRAPTFSRRMRRPWHARRGAPANLAGDQRAKPAIGGGAARQVQASARPAEAARGRGRALLRGSGGERKVIRSAAAAPRPRRIDIDFFTVAGQIAGRPGDHQGRGFLGLRPRSIAPRPTRPVAPDGDPHPKPAWRSAPRSTAGAPPRPSGMLGRGAILSIVAVLASRWEIAGRIPINPAFPTVLRYRSRPSSDDRRRFAPDGLSSTLQPLVIGVLVSASLGVALGVAMGLTARRRMARRAGLHRAAGGAAGGADPARHLRLRHRADREDAGRLHHGAAGDRAELLQGRRRTSTRLSSTCAAPFSARRGSRS